MLELFTYGNSKVAVNLVDILNKNKSYIRSVTNVITKYNTKLYDLRKTEYREYFSHLLYTDTCKKIDGLKWPEKIKTHVKNVLSLQKKEIIFYKKRKGSGKY